MKLSMYVMGSKPISTAYLMKPCHHSVCLYVSNLLLQGKGPAKYISPFSAGQQLGKQVPEANNTSYSGKIVGDVVSYAVYVV
jgi:hypothetical protein